jgi:quercetin dioxygenase-like cupin family protein
MSVERVVQGAHGIPGERGELLLAGTDRVRLRLWEGEEAGETAPEHTNDYDYVAYVIAGRMEVRIGGGEPHELHPGDTYAVPAGTPYSFRVLATAKVIEAVVH